MKLNNEQIKTVVRHFNSKTGLRTKADSNQCRKLFENICSIDGVTENVLIEYIDSLEDLNRNTDFYKVMNKFDIKKYVEDNQPVDVTEVNEQTATTTEQPVVNAQMTLGLLEETLVNVIGERAVPELMEHVKKELTKYVKDTYGDIKRNISYVVPEHPESEVGVQHEAFPELLSYLVAGEGAYLVGPAGTGKNYMTKQAADVMGLDFYSVNKVSQEYELTGFTDANGTYHETEFYNAFTKGGVFLLDELDASIPEVLVLINSALSNGYFTFPAPIGRVEAHEDFHFVAAGNTYGLGADNQYTGRNQLDAASLDRFGIIEVDYDENIENRNCDGDEELLKFFRAYRKAVQKAGIETVVSVRSLNRLHKMESLYEDKLPKLIKSGLTKHLQGDDLRMIQNFMKGENKWFKAFNELCQY